MKFDLNLWTKNMYSLHKRVGVDDRGDLIFHRSELYLKNINFYIMDSREIASEHDYEGRIVARGHLHEGTDLVFISLKCFDDAHKDRSELDLTLYSNNPTILLPLLEQIKQVLWQ
ncbi:MAG: hypothetical protein ACFFEJ_10630 [Candidatus Thorarchaeota archaeon]